MVSCVILSVMLVGLLHGGRCALSTTFNNTVSAVNITALAGEQTVFPRDFILLNDADINKLIYDNKATSINGEANAGHRVVFGSGSQVGGSFVNIESSVSDNVASSEEQLSVSGSQMVFDTLYNSQLRERTIASRNNASTFGVVPDIPVDGFVYPSTVAGSQTLARAAINSEVNLANVAVYNEANNSFGGVAVGGVDQAINSLENSVFVFDNEAAGNVANTVDGSATSGVKIALRDVFNSSVLTSSQSSQNKANAIGGDAVSGVEASVGSAEGLLGQDRIPIELNGVATQNQATATQGKAISGVAFNIYDLYYGNVSLDAEASGNQATVLRGGLNPQNSIAGISVSMGDIQNSTFKMNFTSSENIAYNGQQELYNISNAIAGTQVAISSFEGADASIYASSSRNNATAMYGDAVSGNKILVDYSDAASEFNLNLIASNNSATASNGNAIVDSMVQIRGYGTVTQG